MGDNLKKNASGYNDPTASGYNDPTAYRAIIEADHERERLSKLLNTIFYICDLAGYHVEGWIILRDKKTGKVWR